MRFSLDVMRARKGDCLMLHYGTRDGPNLILIDGGPSNVYKPHLKKRLGQIHKALGLGSNDSLPIDVLMVSHVDDDHIKGILDLTRELRDQKQARDPLLVHIESLWHNSFDDLLKTTPEELSAEAGFGAAALAGKIEAGDHEKLDVAKVLASIPQGRDLRLDAEFLEWKLNLQFDGKLIMATGKPRPVKLDGGLKFTVVGPLKPDIEKLQKEHDKWLHNSKKTGGSGTAALAAFVDKSIPNLSSLVLLAEVQGKRMLLTGDARGDKIIEGLELVKLLPSGARSKMHVDILKVPHHGSSNNVEVSFFERVPADHYVFSGNGEHGNPERETLEMLFAARADEPFVMHFTYPIDEIDDERKLDWEKEREKEKRKNKKPRAKWSPAKNSISALFETRRFAPGQEISIVGVNKPHVIDLLQPVAI